MNSVFPPLVKKTTYSLLNLPSIGINYKKNEGINKWERFIAKAVPNKFKVLNLISPYKKAYFSEIKKYIASMM